MADTAVHPAIHPAVRLTVDLVILTLRDSELCVLLVRRGAEPFTGRWALPGGFVYDQEDPAAAAERELREETDIGAVASIELGAEPSAERGGGPGVGRGAVPRLEQLRTYAAPDRDPRGRVVSIAYLALLPDPPAPTAGIDAVDAGWQPIREVGQLAFDHDIILRDGIARLRDKLDFAPAAAEFFLPGFTITALHSVYEAVWDASLDLRIAHAKQGPARAPSRGRAATHHDRSRQNDVTENDGQQHFDP